MKVGKREKGKIYLRRFPPPNSTNISIYLGQSRASLPYYSFCYRTFSKATGIKIKPGQTIEIEVRAKGGVG